MGLLDRFFPKPDISRQLGSQPEAPEPEPDPDTAPWIDVDSSNLDAVAYYPRRRVLLVRFTSGMVYRYDGVPAGVWNGLLAATSHGTYFGSNIRLAYRYRRLL